MTIAEVKGKVSQSRGNISDRMEDLLTSDVFSTCRYLPAATLLMPWMRTARNLNGKKLAHRLPPLATEPAYSFWPMLGRREPDLLITLPGGRSGKHLTLLLVEAKYLSGKSWAGGELEEAEEASSDQLADEFLELTGTSVAAHAGSSLCDRIVLYVTAHRSIPKEEPGESVTKIPSSRGGAVAGKRDIYWMSWVELPSVIKRAMRTVVDAHQRLLLEDLLALLRRKGLVHFGGYGDLRDIIAGESPAFYRHGAYYRALLPATTIPIGGIYRTGTEGA